MIKVLDTICLSILTGLNISLLIALFYVVITKFLSSIYVPFIIIAAASIYGMFTYITFPLIRALYREIMG